MKTISINNLEKKYNLKAQNKAYIYCNNGICNIESSSDVFGIQLYFKGKAEITPKLPDGWILQGNKKTILIYTLQNITMKNQILFEYEGYIKIMKAISVNKNNEKLSEKILINNSNWDNQKFDFSIDNTNWKEYKNNVRTGKTTTTKYNLPDYDLPKVEPTKKTIKTTQRRRSHSGGY